MPGPASGRVSSGMRRQGRGRDAGVKAASLALPRGSTMRPGHMIMDWLSREPHQVGHRRRVAVLAAGRVRDGVRDRAILLARERSGGPPGTVQRVHCRRGTLSVMPPVDRSCADSTSTRHGSSGDLHRAGPISMLRVSLPAPAARTLPGRDPGPRISGGSPGAGTDRRRCRAPSAWPSPCRLHRQFTAGPQLRDQMPGSTRG